MNNFKKFDYENIEELRQDAKKNDYFLPVSQNKGQLSKSEKIGDKSAPNGLCVNPMEGRDADGDGGPSASTFRRYRRFAAGGAGIIWVEATAVKESGKAHPRQLIINEKSVYGFSQLVEEIKRSARDYNGKKQEPLVILQLTHSGRQSAPNGTPRPKIAKHSNLFDKNYDITSEYPVLTDSQLDEIKDNFIDAAILGGNAGFDGVDVKACHGYLIHELLFSYGNDSSKYRGPFENRISFILNLVREINDKLPELLLASRLNLYDNIPYPDGWGVSRDAGIEPDLTEPISLLNQLQDIGLDLLNVAFGNPYYDPFLERPHDQPLSGDNPPKRHPLEAISMNLKITADIGDKFPNLYKVGGGISWLREYFPDVARAMKNEGWIDAIGLGRLALAKPNFANELLENGNLSGNNLCITCSSCTQMMKDGVEVGCLVRDGEMYGPVYRKGKRKRKDVS